MTKETLEKKLKSVAAKIVKEYKPKRLFYPFLVNRIKKAITKR